MPKIYLDDLRVFCEVESARSFSKAAQKTSKSYSRVSLQVGRLEEALGVLLINRGSVVSATDAGERLARRAPQLIRKIEELGSSSDAADAPGKLRLCLGVPPIFAEEILAKALVCLAPKYSDLDVSIVHDDGYENLVPQGMHASIRISEDLGDTNEIRVILGRAQQTIVASPDYIRCHGAPETIEDLVNHVCLTTKLRRRGEFWTFDTADGQKSVWVKGRIRANFPHALRGVCIEGLGIARYPTYVLRDDIAAGRLIPLLTQYRPIPLIIRAICPISPSKFNPVLQDLLEQLKRLTGEYLSDPG